MSQLIEDTLKLLQHRIDSADIQVVTELNQNLEVVGDAKQLQQVLVNIILNAVQASPQHGTLHIRSRKDIDYIAVEIIDAGAGIAQGDMAKVFDPFFTTKAEGEGTGLGLSVSYGIVKRHGGIIHMENIEGNGLRVVILLPLTEPAKNTESRVKLGVVNVV
jgi:two-component system NtrC family sensor kinase